MLNDKAPVILSQKMYYVGFFIGFRDKMRARILADSFIETISTAITGFYVYS